jgi:hypothetical protein
MKTKSMRTTMSNPKKKTLQSHLSSILTTHIKKTVSDSSKAPMKIHQIEQPIKTINFKKCLPPTYLKKCHKMFQKNHIHNP